MNEGKREARTLYANALLERQKQLGEVLLLPGYVQIIRAGGGVTMEEAIMMPWDSRDPCRGSV